MPLYLIDGTSYVYRAYHAIKNLSTSKGFPTNAVYGFTNMLLKIIRDKQPEALCIIFDAPAPTHRHEIYEAYKAHRPETPADLTVQIPVIKKVVDALRITVFEVPGVEADDVIATLAKKAAGAGTEVLIVSGDKDMMQAVEARISIYDPMKDTTLTEAQVRERFGLAPSRVPEIMALTGDPVDNIPGVKGIGEKTAKDLLAAAGSLQELIDHPEHITSQRIKKMIETNIEMIRLSRTLATVDSDLPLEVSFDELAVKEPNWAALTELFAECEFKSLLRLVPRRFGTGRGEYVTIIDRSGLLKYLEGIV